MTSLGTKIVKRVIDTLIPKRTIDRKTSHMVSISIIVTFEFSCSQGRSRDDMFLFSCVLAVELSLYWPILTSVHLHGFHMRL